MRLKTLRLRRVDLVKVTPKVHPVQSESSFCNPHIITHVMLWEARQMNAKVKKTQQINKFGNYSAGVTDTEKVSHVNHLW